MWMRQLSSTLARQFTNTPCSPPLPPHHPFILLSLSTSARKLLSTSPPCPHRREIPTHALPSMPWSFSHLLSMGKFSSTSSSPWSHRRGNFHHRSSLSLYVAVSAHVEEKIRIDPRPLLSRPRLTRTSSPTPSSPCSCLRGKPKPRKIKLR